MTADEIAAKIREELAALDEDRAKLQRALDELEGKKPRRRSKRKPGPKPKKNNGVKPEPPSLGFGSDSEPAAQGPAP